jgi:predicted dehydrogenase
MPASGSTSLYSQLGVYDPKAPERMSVNSMPARRPQEARDIESATNSPRSVILVGAGRRGLNAHVPAVAACADLQLAGIVDTNERIAQLRDVPELAVQMYDDLDSALAGCAPDLAIVATPHDSHVPLAQQLLRARVPTLLEKPPARSETELATLLDLSLKLRTPLATSLPLHYQDQHQRFTDLLCGPNLTDAEVSIRATVRTWHGAGSWRLSPERAGGGVLIDLGYHYLELLVACLGEPDGKSVLLTSPLGTRREVESEAQVSLWFAERRLQVELWLHSAPVSAGGSELTIRKGGELRYPSPADEPGEVTVGHGRISDPLPTPAAAQLNALVTDGFLDGRGGWELALRRQQTVMRLLDELYEDAEPMACQPETASLPNVACLTEPTGLPERTPA